MNHSVSNHFDVDAKKLSRHGSGVKEKLIRLMQECIECPRTGTGKPESLVGYGSREVWSRRITSKHRLIYEIKKDEIVFLGCYGHYDDH